MSEQELLRMAVPIAAEAAALARRMRAEAITGFDTKSTVTDVVTEADRAVERLISDALRAVRPGDAVFGEELGEHAAGQAREDATQPQGPDGRDGARGLHGRGEPRGPDGRDDTRGPDGRGESRGPDGRDDTQGPDGRGDTPAPAGHGPSQVRWIVDPIDGTVNYLYGIEQYAISIAAEVDGDVVAGVVHNAATGRVWTAARGHGAWRDGRRLTGSAQTDLAQTLVATGFAYAADRRAHQGRVVAGLLPRVRDIRRFGSAALDLCAAADGQVDAFYEKGLAAWDMAAGGLIAREAGLLMTGLNGRPPGPDLVLAAPPALHPRLHDLLSELDAAGGP